jgi:hypothetical protein
MCSCATQKIPFCREQKNKTIKTMSKEQVEKAKYKSKFYKDAKNR